MLEEIAVNVVLAHIHPKANAVLPFADAVSHYLKLASKWIPAETKGFGSEASLNSYLEGGRQRPAVILCDQRGKSPTSEEFAGWIRQRRDGGIGQIVLGIGPADGWSKEILGKADLRLSFGAMTLPHALARLVLAEQVYRAATIIGGHPYHLGH